MSDIKNIKQALAHATPAPWIYQQGGYGRKSIVHQEHNHDLVCGIAENLDSDGYLIANAPTWLSSLITTIESQKEEIEGLTDRNRQLQGMFNNENKSSHRYFEQIESLKAITELAVKEKDDENGMVTAMLEADILHYKTSASSATHKLKLAAEALEEILNDVNQGNYTCVHEIAASTLTEITRIQNAQT